MVTAIPVRRASVISSTQDRASAPFAEPHLLSRCLSHRRCSSASDLSLPCSAKACRNNCPFRESHSASVASRQMVRWTAVDALAQSKLGATRPTPCCLEIGIGAAVGAVVAAGAGGVSTFSCAPSRHSTRRSVSSIDIQRAASSGDCGLAGRPAASNRAAPTKAAGPMLATVRMTPRPWGKSCHSTQGCGKALEVYHRPQLSAFGQVPRVPPAPSRS